MKKKLKKQQQQQNAEGEEEEEEHEHGEDDTHVIPNTAPLTTRGVDQCLLLLKLFPSSPASVYAPLFLVSVCLLFALLSLLTHIPHCLILLHSKYDASVVGVTSIMSITGKALLFW